MSSVYTHGVMAVVLAVDSDYQVYICFFTTVEFRYNVSLPIMMLIFCPGRIPVFYMHSGLATMTSAIRHFGL